MRYWLGTALLIVLCSVVFASGVQADDTEPSGGEATHNLYLPQMRTRWPLADRQAVADFIRDTGIGLMETFPIVRDGRVIARVYTAYFGEDDLARMTEEQRRELGILVDHSPEPPPSADQSGQTDLICRSNENALVQWALWGPSLFSHTWWFIRPDLELDRETHRRLLPPGKGTQSSWFEPLEGEALNRVSWNNLPLSAKLLLAQCLF